MPRVLGKLYVPTQLQVFLVAGSVAMARHPTARRIHTENVRAQGRSLQAPCGAVYTQNNSDVLSRVLVLRQY